MTVVQTDWVHNLQPPVWLKIFELMDAKVKSVLEQAAQRAERYALLDSAITGMERLLNQTLVPEMLPWGSAMSTSYMPFKSTNFTRFMRCISS